MLFVHRLDVLLQVILPLEPVRTDGADVRLGAVWFFVYRWLVGLHDVGAEVVSLQKALVTKVTSVRLDLWKI